MIARRSAFRIGTVAISAGVLLHVPEFIDAADDRYMMAGMPMSAVMITGMALISGGLGLATWGVLPPRGGPPARPPVGALAALDRAPLRRAHVILTVVLGVGLVIDTMKPATLGFVLPGLAEEYGIGIPGAAMLPLVALTGTTVGSVVWGLLADRIGRRPTILLSGLLFMATSICGFMPNFGWNLVMCFAMGASAGGMLPIAYALMAESVPASARGWLVVLQTGLGSVCGYLVASAAAALLEPHLGWRVLWTLGLPTGLLLIILNRWIPESPRFLLTHGRVAEAHAVMARYGVMARNTPAADPAGPPAPVAGGLRAVFGRPYTPHTLTVLLYGIAWGLINWGFITFLPTFFRQQGTVTGGLLFLGALLAIPNTVLVAYLYGRWSSRRSMILYAALTTAVLLTFTVLPGQYGWQLVLLVAALLTSTGGMIAMLAPYTAEIYPTALRGSGSGLSAAATKLGGMIGPPLVGPIAVSTGPRLIAFLVAVPVAAAAGVLAATGRETARQPLPEAGPTRRAQDASASGPAPPRTPRLRPR